MGMGKRDRKMAETNSSIRIMAPILAGALLLGGCDLLQRANPVTVGNEASISTVERDVEAPEVYDATQAGTWDGRASMGGVWVAVEDTIDPERVIIRNPSNGNFVIGTMFAKARAIEQSGMQVSADAAAALGVAPGTPTSLQVTALRREAPAQQEIRPASTTVVAPDAAPTPLAPLGVETPANAPEVAQTEVKPVARPANPTPVSQLSKPFVQIGIFSVEGNARSAAETLRAKGITARVVPQEFNNKPFWRVVAGPARNQSDRDRILGIAKSAGFADAYFVSG